MYLGNRRCCVNNIVQGITGSQGPQGAYGNIGNIGLTGSTGATGAQGSVGICHSNGKSEKKTYNLKYSFLIGNGQYSNDFIELTSLATIPVANTIVLNSGIYTIQYQISENWTNTNSIFYIELTNGIKYYSYVFNPINESYLVLSTNGTNLFGIGNDVINLPNNTTYAVKIYQSNTSGTTVLIDGKTVYFSITFTKIS